MRAKEHLEALLRTIVTDMGLEWSPKTTIEPPKDKQFGDLAVNSALVLAKEARRSPRELAEDLAARLNTASDHIASVEIAGPGFINVTFAPAFWQESIARVEEKGDKYGSSEMGKGKKVQVEYVSANPTGPLHIGHGRGAAVGDSLVRILRFTGYETTAEYYINDAGKQMRTLGVSIWLRAREMGGRSSEPFPEGHYQGDYIKDIAGEMLDRNPGLLDLPEEEGIDACYEYGMQSIFDGIKQDLADFRVEHNVWYSERELVRSGAVEKALELLRASGFAYEEEGALWFRSTDFGDDKDRVLRKSDGSLTYFASDIAYHADKYERGFDYLIDIWGADHHGYAPRMRAAVAALGKEQSSFDVILIQLVNLMRDGQQIAMSTRAGQFDTLAEVLREVGPDAARFIFLSRKSDSKLDFDLELAKQRTMDNPVYYVQYAHARIMAILRRAGERGLFPEGGSDLSVLQQEEELDLLRYLDRFPLVVEDAATGLASHFISYYLMELAGLLHRYYNAHIILETGGTGSDKLTLARLRLIRAVAQTVRNGLHLLGVSAPESM